MCAAFLLAAVHHQARDWDFSLGIALYRIKILWPQGGEAIRSVHKWSVRNAASRENPPLKSDPRELMWVAGPSTFKISVSGPGLRFVKWVFDRVGLGHVGRWIEPS